MARKKRHPLYRYAKPVETQHQLVAPIASVLADEGLESHAKYVAAWDYRKLVERGEFRFQGDSRWELEWAAIFSEDDGERVSAASRLDEIKETFDEQVPYNESMIVHRLTWFRALSDMLRERNHRSPDVTPELVFDLTEQFHWLPASIRVSTLFKDLVTGDHPVSFDHAIQLVKWSPVRLSPTASLREGVRGYYKLAEYIRKFASEVNEKEWTPKQLENAIKRSRGSRGAGRPKKPV